MCALGHCTAERWTRPRYDVRRTITVVTAANYDACLIDLHPRTANITSSQTNLVLPMTDTVNEWLNVTRVRKRLVGPDAFLLGCYRCSIILWPFSVVAENVFLSVNQIDHHVANLGARACFLVGHNIFFPGRLLCCYRRRTALAWKVKQSYCVLPLCLSNDLWTSVFTARRCSMLARYVPSSSVSVCLSVTRRYCIETAKPRMTRTMPHDSPV